MRKSTIFTLRKAMLTAVSLCLALAMTACSVQPAAPVPEQPDLPQITPVPEVRTLAAAEYPEMMAYPGINASGEQISQWREGLQKQMRQDYGQGMEACLQALTAQLLADNDGKNALCSPLNIYMALAMLAEITDGDSRAQLLDLLGSADVETLRQQANDLWNDTYRDDGILQRVLANAIWLNEDLTFKQEALDTLAQQYYASSFWGRMGSAEYDQALQDWLNEQTGGLLADQIGQLHMDPATVLALTSTVYFKAKWSSGGFAAENTAPGIFRGTEGDVECDMMHSSRNESYYWGDKFTAVTSSFESGEMRFLLPDEGHTPEDLLQDAEAMEFLTLSYLYDWENTKRMKVNRTVPKFDVSSQMKLKGDLQALGVTAVFDGQRADFSPVTEQKAFVSDATHGVRVKIDERGCEAAAYVMMVAPTAAPPQQLEEIDFTLDRPFLFVITNGSGLPLFVGIVNQP